MVAQRFCYIGELGSSGALDWNASPGGNVPASGTLPDLEESSIYFKIMELARKGEYHGAIIDWDAYGLKVNGPELNRIMLECYPAPPDGSVEKKYIDFAASLGPDRYMALVAVAI